MGVSGICMLETNVINFSEETKSHVDLKPKTKENDIRKEIKDNSIRRISVQSKALKGHAEYMKDKFNYSLKEANDAKPVQKKGPSS